jgi:DNA modification methylase
MILGDDPFAGLDEAAEGTRRSLEDLPDDFDDEGLPTDEAPVVEKPVVRSGEVWTLGRHRLVCGDARDEAILRLATGTDDPAPLILTDPPYCSGGFQEAGKAAGTFGDIASDNLSTRGYQTLISKVIQASRGQAVYIFTDWRMWIPLFETVEAGGAAVRAMIVWDKKTPGLGSFWRTQHELIMFASRSGAKRRKGEPSVGNVIQCRRSGNRHHYTEKPVELLVRILENDARSDKRPGDTPVLDPFVGSGSTIMAAEHTGRVCHALDIEPRCCQVALERWAAHTGEQPVCEGTGETLAEAKANRAPKAEEAVAAVVDAVAEETPVGVEPEAVAPKAKPKAKPKRKRKAKKAEPVAEGAPW